MCGLSCPIVTCWYSICRELSRKAPANNWPKGSNILPADIISINRTELDFVDFVWGRLLDHA